VLGIGLGLGLHNNTNSIPDPNDNPDPNPNGMGEKLPYVERVQRARRVTNRGCQMNGGCREGVTDEGCR